MLASGRLLNPMITGVPTAPKGTGALSATNAIVAAAIGLKPKATSNGPVTTAGVPNPAAPSINAQIEKRPK